MKRRRVVLRVLLATAIAASTALSSAPSSRGGTADVHVPVTIVTSTSLDTSGCTSPTLGAVSRGMVTISTSSCSVSFDTNSANGASLSIADSDGQPGLNTPDLNVISAVATWDSQLAPTAYGMCLSEVQGATNRVALDATCTAAEAVWFGPSWTDLAVVDTTAPGAASARFQFGLSTDPTTAPGAYSTSLRFTVTPS